MRVSPGVRQRVLVGGLAGALAALFAVSIGSGPAALPLLPSLVELVRDDPGVAALILGEIRLPRALLAVAIGASLGLAGAALQGLLRNPLADPGIIGVSSSAALGVVLVLYFGIGQLAAWTLPAAGMVGAGAAVAGILLLAGRGSSILTVILAGVAINAFAGALTSLAINLAPSPFAIVEIVFWLLGSLADRSFEHVWLALPPTLLGWLLLLSTRRGLDALPPAAEDEPGQGQGHHHTHPRQEGIQGGAGLDGAQVGAHRHLVAVPEQAQLAVEQLQPAAGLRGDEPQGLVRVVRAPLRRVDGAGPDRLQLQALPLGPLAHVGRTVGPGVGPLVEAPAPLEGHGTALHDLVARQVRGQGQHHGQGHLRQPPASLPPPHPPGGGRRQQDRIGPGHGQQAEQRPGGDRRPGG